MQQSYNTNPPKKDYFQTETLPTMTLHTAIAEAYNRSKQPRRQHTPSIVMHFIKKEQLNKMTVDEIIEVVCERYKIDPKLIYLKSRFRNIVSARQMCSLVLYETGRYSKSEIGRIFNQDHTTILHNIGILKGHLDVHPDVKANYRYIKNRIR